MDGGGITIQKIITQFEQTVKQICGVYTSFFLWYNIKRIFTRPQGGRFLKGGT